MSTLQLNGHIPLRTVVSEASECPFDRLVNDYFPQELQPLFAKLPQKPLIVEIRFRLGQPILVQYRLGEELFLGTSSQKWLCSLEIMNYILQRINQNSVYAWEEEYKRGYLTIAGGHRVGLAGKTLLSNGEIRSMKQISSLNFRIANEVIGAADKAMAYIVQNNQLLNTLIAAPPGCGKTTLLRDITRQISDGLYAPLKIPLTVGLVDERSEIAATLNGVPQLNVGSHTDILDGCPKSQGMLMLIRAMAPKVIITDEIGSQADVLAMQQALSAGVKLITTIHGQTWEDLLNRPFTNELIKGSFFQRIIFLDNHNGRGQIRSVLAYHNNRYEPVSLC